MVSVSPDTGAVPIDPGPAFFESNIRSLLEFREWIEKAHTEVAPAEPESIEVPLTSAEILKVAEALSKQHTAEYNLVRSHLSALYEIRWRLQSEGLGDVGSNCEFVKSIKTFVAATDQAIQACGRSQALKETIEMLAERYEEALLKEAGYSTREEVSQRIAAVESEVSALDSRIFGRTRFAKRLRALASQQDDLEKLPGGPRFSNPVDPPWFAISPEESQRLGSNRAEVLSMVDDHAAQLLGKLSHQVEQHFIEQASSVLAERWGSLADFFCSHELVPYFRQEINRHRRYGSIYDRASDSNYSLTSPQGRLAISSARQMISRNVELDSFSQDPEVRALSAAVYGLQHPFSEPVQRLQRQDLRGQVTKVLALTLMLGDESVFGLLAKANDMGPVAEYALKDFIPDTFAIAARFLERERLASPDRIQQLKSLMVEPVLTALTTSQEHTDATIRLGWKLYALHDVRALPYAVLNALREPGNSGERPFLSIHAHNSRETTLYEYVSRFSADELQAAESLKIPGLMRALELIRSNGRNFARAYLVRPREDGSGGAQTIPNPVWRDLRSAVHEMCLHYLEHGSRDEQFFVMAVIKDAEDELPTRVLDQLARIMEQSDDELRAELYDLLLARVSRGVLEPRLARIAIGHFAAQEPGAAIDLNVVGRAYVAFLRRDLPEEVKTDLAKVFGVTTEKISTLHALASHINGRDSESCFRSFEPYTHDLGLTFKSLLRCTDVPNVVKRLERLCDAGYRYAGDHVEVLPDLFQDADRVIAECLFIRRYEPDFSFGPRERFGQKGSFELEPFAQWFEMSRGVNVLERVAPILRDEGSLPVVCRNGLFRHLVASYAGDWSGLTEEKLSALEALTENMLRDPPEQYGRHERALRAYASFLSRGLGVLPLEDAKEIFCRFADTTEAGIQTVMAIVHHYWPGVATDRETLERLLAPFSEIASNGVTDDASWRSLLSMLDIIRPQLQGVSAFDELETLADYVREFGTYNLPRTFCGYLTLHRKEPPTPDLAAVGVTATGSEGIRQLKGHLAKMRAALLSPSGSVVPGSPIDVELLTVLSRFEESQWARGGDLADLVTRFNADFSAGSIGPVPTWLSSGSFRVEKVDSESLGKFDFAKPVQERFEALKGDIRAVEHGDLMATSVRLIEGIARALESRAYDLEQPLGAEDKAKDLGGKREAGRQKEARRVRGVVEQLKKLELERAEQVDSAIQIIAEFERVYSAATTPALRQLVLMRALRLAHRSTDFYKLSEATLNLESLASLTELFRDVVLEEALPQLSLSKRAFQRIKQACSTKALEEEITRIGQLGSVGFEEWTAVPCRGFLGEMSGYIADACWTRISNIMREHPNVTPVILVRNYQRPNERIIGALLLIEARSRNGEPTIVLRGVNPQQNYVTRVKAGSFFESLIDQWLAPQAKQAQIGSIGVPGGKSGGSQTNRPTLNVYLKSAYAEAEPLLLADDPPTTFNGYDINESCVVVRDLAAEQSNRE